MIDALILFSLIALVLLGALLPLRRKEPPLNSPEKGWNVIRDNNDDAPNH